MHTHMHMHMHMHAPCLHAHTWTEHIGVGAQRRQQRRRLRVGQRRAARAPRPPRHLFACENDRTALPSTATVEVPARLRTHEHAVRMQ